jgi:ferredoxin/flavodoxin---NADP+ reductase
LGSKSSRQSKEEMGKEPDAGPAARASEQKVLEVKRWTDVLMSFRTTRPEGFAFSAGQYARLGLSIDGQVIWRAYSLTSSPQDDHLEYYGVIVPGGLFTSKLVQLAPGDAIWTEKQPYGFMTADRFTDGNELWMLATGTGIGPYISMLREGDKEGDNKSVWQRFKRLVLVHGVRHASELSYFDELRALRDNPPPHAKASLQLVHCVTRDDAPSALAGAPLLNGRITSLLQNGALEQAAGMPLTVENSRIMLCGNPAMIEETRALLHARGMRPVRRALPGQFLTENYW